MCYSFFVCVCWIPFSHKIYGAFVGRLFYRIVNSHCTHRNTKTHSMHMWKYDFVFEFKCRFVQLRLVEFWCDISVVIVLVLLTIFDAGFEVSFVCSQQETKPGQQNKIDKMHKYLSWAGVWNNICKDLSQSIFIQIFIELVAFYLLPPFSL